MSSIANQRLRIRNLTLSAILTAFGILIPIIMPVKLVLGPASFTLASHVPLFMAIFISPAVAVSVALGTAAGFFLSGFGPIIVARALTHVIFALVGALLIKKHPQLLKKPRHIFLLALGLNALHGLFEFGAVIGLTWTDQLSSAYLYSMLGLIGLGSMVHGMIDFYLALYCWRLFLGKEKASSTSGKRR